MTNAPPIAFLVPSQAVVGSRKKGSNYRCNRDKTTGASCPAGSDFDSTAKTTAAATSAKATPSTSALHMRMLAPSQAIKGSGPSSSSAAAHSKLRRKNRRTNNQMKRSDTALTAASTSSSDEAPATKLSAFPDSYKDKSHGEPDHNSLSSSSPTYSASSSKYQSNNNNGTAKTKTKPRSSRRQQLKHRTTGNIPDVHWRAIPLEHLRHHPSFEALPHPDTITTLDSLEDVRLFRQDSWQWDALHSGRCTTSQATAALGLLESKAGGELGIPRSLQKGAVGAYHRLSQPGLRSLEDMREVLCTGEGNSPPELDMLDYRVWDTKAADKARDEAEKNEANGNSGKNGKTKASGQQQQKGFNAFYLPRIKKSDLDRRRNILKDYYLKDSSQWVARMQWGNAQEPTALLTALNYFTRAVPGTKIREVGMCGAGLDINNTASNEVNGLIIGATPDAVIHYPNGTLESLEVKNHCPFVPMYWGSRKPINHDKDLFRIRETRLPLDVPPAYVPQLMLEMLSLGPQCRSAVMVRQTATKGAVILRLQRDDEWIDEMVYWLNEFVDRFVNRGVPPPPNVFWDDNEHSGGERYRTFVNRTKEISLSAQLVARIPHGDIQRVIGSKRHIVPLFLD